MDLIKYFMRKEFIVYAIVGGIGAIIDILAYYLLTFTFGVSYLIAHVISVWLASSFKFIVNKFFTFNNKSKRVKKQYLYSLIVLIIYLIITEVMLYAFVDYFGLGQLVSKILVLVLGLSINYVLDKKLTFRIE